MSMKEIYLISVKSATSRPGACLHCNLRGFVWVLASRGMCDLVWIGNVNVQG